MTPATAAALRAMLDTIAADLQAIASQPDPIGPEQVQEQLGYLVAVRTAQDADAIG